MGLERKMQSDDGYIKLQQTADIKIFWFPLSISRESINEKARNKNRSSLEPIIDPS